MSEPGDTQRVKREGENGPDRPDASSELSKDAFFERVAALSNEMIERHGTEFAMGTLVLAAKFIAEGKPLTRNPD